MGADVIASVHIADVGVRAALAAVRKPPRSRPGLRYGAALLSAPLSGALLARPDLGRIAFLGFWDDDDALDAFLADDPIADRLAGGWHARLSPVRVSGEWPGLSTDVTDGRTEGPAVTVTLGHLRPSQAVRFLRASARAEAAVLDAPGFVWGTALGRPPLVATCSLWEDSAALAAYAYRPGAHADVITANRERPFHRDSAFVRFRPYRCAGQLDGRNPMPVTAWARPI